MIRCLLLLCSVVGLMAGSARSADLPAKSATSEKSATSQSSRPNVLFIAVDDLNDWIGCLGGHPQTQTPNLDRLAARGVLFKNAYCCAPACNPSRTALMFGLRPTTTGVYMNSQDWRPVLKDKTSLARLFREAGYDVQGAGKIFHGGWNDTTGWDDYQNKVGDPKPTKEVLNDPHSKAGGIIWGRLDASVEEMGDHATVDYCANFLKNQGDDPFFLACGIYRPHMPWQVPSKFYDMFPVDSVVLPEVPADDLQDIPAAGVKMAKPTGDHANVTSSDNWKYAVQAYLASIAYADYELGRLLDALDASEHKQDTIVILWGDHGWHLGEKMHWRKFALWEEATHAPLMITVPGMTKPGTVISTPMEYVHIYPTLADLCGVKPPADLDGESFKSLLENSQAKWAHPALTTHGRGNNAVRNDRYRYIRYEDGSEELYDHNNDPDEWNNLAGDEASKSILARLGKFIPQEEAKNAPFGGKAGDGDDEQPMKKAGKNNAGKNNAKPTAN